MEHYNIGLSVTGNKTIFKSALIINWLRNKMLSLILLMI